jgi:hypothetical protein
MEVMIHTAESRVYAVHGEALLNDTVLNKIVTHVVARVNECQRHDRVVENERKMRPNLTSEEISFWE